MGKSVKCYKVTNLTRVDTTKYVEGDIFLTGRSVGILVNGQIKTFAASPPNLKNYVKKEDVKKMIQEELEKNGQHE